jgi:ATP-dependent RNA helicase DeaD
MTKPVEITSGQKNTGSDDVSHEYYLVTERTRYQALKRIADLNPNIYAIIFCRTRRETQEVADNLIKDGYNADALHGELSQAQRDSVMGKFRKKNVQILVATDVAARGLDVNSLTHVINHKLPDQIENYTHRSGRTGRAGKTGISIALVSNKEKGRIGAIERIIKKKFVQGKVPSGKEICQNQLMHLIDKVNAIEVKQSEIEDFLPSIYEKLEGLSREELIQKFVSLEFNSFLSYYENARDLNDLSSKDTGRNGRGSNENMTRFFINIGRKDSLNPARLIGLINDQKITDNIEIGAIDILDTFSFFEIDKKFEEQTLNSFSENQPEFSGRGVNIEITKKERGGGRRRGGKRPFGNKDGGGFGRRRNSEKSSGGRRSENNNKNKSSSRRGGDRPDRNSNNDRKPSGFGRKRRERR